VRLSSRQGQSTTPLRKPTHSHETEAKKRRGITTLGMKFGSDGYLHTDKAVRDYLRLPVKSWPSFITRETLSCWASWSMWVRGSKGVAMMSASLPGAMEPRESSRPRAAAALTVAARRI
jgi:hypothetical protein